MSSLETTKLNTQSVLSNSCVAFGTSGARGLVSQFSDDVCAAFTVAFLSALKANFTFNQVAVGIDNRPSSPQMAKATIRAIEELGLLPIYCGVLPTPALAYYAMGMNIPCIMITGSHIPFDRNGIKFYRPDGEISKEDEASILNAALPFNPLTSVADIDLAERREPAAITAYVARYTNLFDAEALSGFKIGIYEHSSAGREIYKTLFQSLGAEVVSLERSDVFVPIDTEAVSLADQEKAKKWSQEFGFDMIFSTDGDGDRPLVADEKGRWLRGDILCLLTAKLLGIKKLAVPVSCNTAIEKSNCFDQVVRTKIGSPYVIAAFDSQLSLEQVANGAEHDGVAENEGIAGFEANGGFLLANDVVYNSKVIKALPTRDALLPAIILAVNSCKTGISRFVAELPQRYSASDRIQDFATSKSQQIIADLKQQPEKLTTLLDLNLVIADVDDTDGCRITFSNDDIVHLRPSGNAPELRCYAESTSNDAAVKLVNLTLCKITEYQVG